MENCRKPKNESQLSEIVAGLLAAVICTTISSFTKTEYIKVWVNFIYVLIYFFFLEVNQDFIFKMESPSYSAVISPSTPRDCANAPSPCTSSSRKQVRVSSLSGASHYF